MLDLLLEYKLIDEGIAETIKEECKPLDLRLTKSMSQIDSLLLKLQNLNVSQRLDSLLRKKKDLNEEIDNIESISNQIKDTSWF